MWILMVFFTATTGSPTLYSHDFGTQAECLTYQSALSGFVANFGTHPNYQGASQCVYVAPPTRAAMAPGPNVRIPSVPNHR